MPKLIILNIGTEQMLGQNLSHAKNLLTARAAWRNVWFAEENDILVMPVPMKANFIDYIGDILGFNGTSLTIITPDDFGEFPGAITDEKLLSINLINKLKPCIGRFDTWTIMACYYSVGIVELASKLGINAPPGKEFAEQQGVDLFNRKGQFRRLAAGINLPLAKGTIAYDPATLAKAINKNIHQTGTVIIKQDNGVFNMGNIAVTLDEPRPLPGVYATYHIEKNVAEMADHIWQTLSSHWSRELVVESYHNASHMLYSEYFIAENGHPHFLNNGLVRLQADSNPDAKELLWLGLDIPAELPSYSFASVVSESMRFALFASELGYRGYINIDAIITDKEEVIFNEVNGRWGGCTILHILAERLLGPNYGNKHILRLRRNIHSPPLDELLEILQNNKLAFNKEKKEGVLVLSCDEVFTHNMDCMIVASSRNRISEIEECLLNTLMIYERKKILQV